MQRHERGYWLTEGGHLFDVSLAHAIADVLDSAEVDTIIDIGCGNGAYTQYFNSLGFDCIGFDGNPLTEQVTGGKCHVADFSEPQDFGIFDAALCLEVGEHIPEDYEDILLENLDRHAVQIIVLSWAVPQQGGYGHINERENDYIISSMNALGWVIDWASSNAIREKASNCYWFRNTLMVFRRAEEDAVAV